MIPTYSDSPEDLQRMVDVVVRGLRSQGFEQSLSIGGACRVRGLDGRKCAAGWLLPDEVYDHTYEDLGRIYKTAVPGNVAALLLGELQNAHDGIGIDEDVDPDALEARLRSAVSAAGLAWPE